MPKWMPINFDEDDYGQIVERWLSKVDSLPESTVIGEIATSVEQPNGFVVPPTGGALPQQDAKDVPLTQLDKATLAKMCREDFDPPITTTVDGVPFKGNTLKGEYKAAIEARRAADAAAPVATPTETPAPESDAASASPEPAPETPSEAPDPAPEEPTAPTEEPVAPATPVEAAPEAATPAQEPTEAHDEAVANIIGTLGGQVVSETTATEDVPVTPEPVETPAAAPAAKTAGTCEYDGCETDLGGEDPDIVKLSFIRFKKKLCKPHYQELKG